MLKVYLCAFFIGTALNVFSQQFKPSVISPAGGVSQSRDIMLEWTVGEPVIETVFSPYSLFTQGFHQPTLLITKTEKKEAVEDNTVLQIYPNPTSSLVHMRFSKVPEFPLLVLVVDMNGKNVYADKISIKSTTYTINVNSFTNGTYYLRLTDTRGRFHGEYKIIKLP